MEENKAGMRVERKKKRVWLWVLTAAVVLAAAGVACWLLWPRPLVTAPG